MPAPLGGLGFQQGQHVCSLYHSREEQQRVALAYVAEGLRKNERCLYVADTDAALDQFAAASVGDARSGALGEELRARVFARLGDKERALASLERLLSAPADGLFGPPVTPAILRLDPVFDSLRSDPRFEKLCPE